MKKFMFFASCILLVMGIIAFGQLPAAAKGQGKNGTTLAAYKTVDICSVDENTWRYSGEIAVWNEGAVDTVGLAIEDCIQFKAFDGSGPFADVSALCQDLAVTEIPAGTTMPYATTFKYEIEGAPLLDGYIRNSAYLTILNHSGSLGTPKGPNPKANYTGTIPPSACPTDCGGCVEGQGYWKNNTSWPNGYLPTDTFFNATKQVCIQNCGGNPNDDVYETDPASWEDVLQNPGGNGYYILAVQYIAAVLNKANGACVPDGVQATIDLAEAWLENHLPSDCDAGGSCGEQKDWGGVLADYNSGTYTGGPSACSN
jgi:hypothetical protein